MQPAWAKALRYGFVNQTLYAASWQAASASQHLFAKANRVHLQEALCQTESVSELNAARMTALALAAEARDDLLLPAFRNTVFTLPQFLLLSQTLQHLRLEPTGLLRSLMKGWLAEHLTPRDAQHQQNELAPILRHLRPQTASWPEVAQVAATYLLGERSAMPRQIVHKRLAERFRAGQCEAVDLEAIRRHQFSIAEVRLLLYELHPEDQEEVVLTALPFSSPDELPALLALFGTTPPSRLADALSEHFAWLDRFERQALGPWGEMIPKQTAAPTSLPRLHIFVGSAYAMTSRLAEIDGLLLALAERLTWGGLYDLTPMRIQAEESLSFPLQEGQLENVVREGDQLLVLTSGYDVPDLERRLRALPSSVLRLVWHAGGQRDVAPRFGGSYFAYGAAPLVSPVLSHFLTEYEEGE